MYRSHTDQTERGVTILAGSSRALGCVACWFLPERLSTYMALIIQFVVGKLQLVEADHLPHPSLPRGRRVGMNVHPGWHRGVSIACHHPFRAVVNVPTGQRPTVKCGLPQLLELPTRTKCAPFSKYKLISLDTR